MKRVTKSVEDARRLYWDTCNSVEESPWSYILVAEKLVAAAKECFHAADRERDEEKWADLLSDAESMGRMLGTTGDKLGHCANDIREAASQVVADA